MPALPPSADPGTRPEGVAAGEAARHVREMFNAVAPRYDRANHLLSLATDMYWRRETAERIRRELPDPAELLDICCGTGDLSFALAARLRPSQRVWSADFSHAMLLEAGKKSASRPAPRAWLEADALRLPFADSSLHAVATSFGFRNLGDYLAGLREFARVLRPGGRLYILEFFQPSAPIFGRLYHWYFTRILPRLGHWLTGRLAPYQYLPRSVAHFATPQELAAWMRAAGFEPVTWRRLSGGICALHCGQKPHP